MRTFFDVHQLRLVLVLIRVYCIYSIVYSLFLFIYLCLCLFTLINIATVMDEFRMDTTAMDSTINSNYKFVNPPTFSVHDSSGYLITSGPDSSLVS